MSVEVFRSTVRWSGSGLKCQAEVRGFPVIMDEPASLGGTNQGMNPVELLLSALGGCAAITAAAFAPMFQVDLKDVTVELKGDLDPDGFMGKNPNVRTGFQDVRLTLHLVTDSPQDRVERLIKLVEQRCPVSDTLKGVPVHLQAKVDAPALALSVRENGDAAV